MSQFLVLLWANICYVTTHETYHPNLLSLSFFVVLHFVIPRVKLSSSFHFVFLSIVYLFYSIGIQAGLVQRQIEPHSTQGKKLSIIWIWNAQMIYKRLTLTNYK